MQFIQYTSPKIKVYKNEYPLSLLSKLNNVNAVKGVSVDGTGALIINLGNSSNLKIDAIEFMSDSNLNYKIDIFQSSINLASGQIPSVVAVSLYSTVSNYIIPASRLTYNKLNSYSKHHFIDFLENPLSVLNNGNYSYIVFYNNDSTVRNVFLKSYCHN